MKCDLLLLRTLIRILMKHLGFAALSLVWIAISLSSAQGQVPSLPPLTTPNVGGQPSGLNGPPPGFTSPGRNANNSAQFAPLPPAAPDFAANNFNSFNNQIARNARSLGANRGSFSSAPTIFGDFFGGGFSAFSGSQRVTRSFTGAGSILSPGPNQLIGFENGIDDPGNDVFSTGLGMDSSGDSTIDTFSILEPLPGSDAPTSPGPGFVYDPASGRAVYVGNSNGQTAINGVFTDGENWFVSYDYVSTISGPGPVIPVPGPGVATRRVKISENYIPEVRDRLFLNYSYFSNAYGGLGNINRYVLGIERIVFEDLISIEARLPIAATYGSNQSIGKSQTRRIELGNAAIIAKAVMLRGDDYTWSSGVGVGLPLADDTVLRSGDRELLRVENETVHISPFTSLLYRYSQDWAFQGLMQLDVAANGDTIRGDLTGATKPKLGKFNDSTLLHLDVAATRSLYRNCCCSSRVRQILLNGELHYTGTLQSSDFVSSGGITYTNLAKNFNILNATVGTHFVLANNMVISPAMSVPLRDGLDKQFDYEAQIQVNYLR